MGIAWLHQQNYKLVSDEKNIKAQPEPFKFFVLCFGHLLAASSVPGTVLGPGDLDTGGNWHCTLAALGWWEKEIR